MSRLLQLLYSTVLLAIVCDAQSTVTLTSIQPPKIQVNLTYIINGQRSTVSPPCTQQAPGAECLAKPHAVRDSIYIQYGVLPQFQANTSDTVRLAACYSPFSVVNRPWRAPNNVIAKGKSCGYPIARGLNPAGGNATWKIPQNATTGTYYIRALVYAPNPASPANPNPVAVGVSPGYFQVVPIGTREKGLVVAAAICICVGPIMFTLLMLYEFKFKKA